MKSASVETIAAAASSAGLSLFGFTSAAPCLDAARHLKTWQGEGFAGEMKYMGREAKNLASPEFLLPGARSVITFAVKYGSFRAPPREKGFGRVARYAWGRDYHLVLRDRLTVFLETLTKEVGAFKARAFSDAVPLLERPFAERSGVGFVGKNTLIIRPGQGSLFFLAEVITDLEIEGGNPNESKGSCGSCQSCIDKCPTKAIRKPYVVDARLCISYLTIEKKGELTEVEEESLGEWIFGCDICQEVCPFNHAPIKLGQKADETLFAAEFGAGANLSLAEVLSIRSDDLFKARFEGSPLLRPGRAGLLRNALAVAANTDWIEGSESITATLSDDPSDIVRASAVRSIIRLSLLFGSAERLQIKKKLEAALKDQSSLVINAAEKGLISI